MARVTPEELGKNRGFDFPVEVVRAPRPKTEVNNTTDEAQQGPLDVDALSAAVASLFRCDFPGCPRTFETRRALSYHKNHSHLAGEQDTNKSGITIPGYRVPASIQMEDGSLQCSACHEVYDDEKSMGSHKRTHYADARASYVRDLEVAVAEVSGLRRALREAQAKLEGRGSDKSLLTPEQPNQSNGVNIGGLVQEQPLTVERAVDFILESIGMGDERILELERENRRLSDLVDSLSEDDQGEAIATIGLIKEAFHKFQRGDLTMPRFLSDVEEALTLLDPSITDNDE